MASADRSLKGQMIYGVLKDKKLPIKVRTTWGGIYEILEFLPDTKDGPCMRCNGLYGRITVFLSSIEEILEE
ncbi:MAG TPA: hypothetical protein VK190_03445 [Pseudoneobacillus sp.]|nr:hypothetical protein [Pseudoneobacillus sp.]